MSGYEFFEHTADVGIKASSASLQEMFVQMARGLRELLVEDSKIAAAEQRTLHLSASSAPELLFVWLRELLFLFSTEGFIPAEYWFEQLTETSLTVQITGGRFDPLRHVQGREVKAITRHQFEVSEHNGMWSAKVIVDI